MAAPIVKDKMVVLEEATPAAALEHLEAVVEFKQIQQHIQVLAMDLMADFRLLHGPMLVEVEVAPAKMAIMLLARARQAVEEMEGQITTKQVPT